MAKIFLSAGHGGSDSGAVGNGYKEKDLTLKLAIELGTILSKAGHTVIQNRTTDVNGFGTVVQTANKSGAAAFFEIHLNAGGGTGTEVFYYPSDKAKNAVGYRMAGVIAASLSKEMGWRNRGAKPSEGNYDFKVVRETTMPANLVEVCFIDSASDMKTFNVSRAAKAIAKGICEIWGGSVVEANPEPVPEPNPDPVPTPEPEKPKPVPVDINVARTGDKVDFIGGYVYTNSGAKNNNGKAPAKNGATITNRAPGNAHPFHLKYADGAELEGWVDANTVFNLQKK